MWLMLLLLLLLQLTVVSVAVVAAGAVVVADDDVVENCTAWRKWRSSAQFSSVQFQLRDGNRLLSLALKMQ